MGKDPFHDKDQQTPLHEAAQNRNYKAVKALLDGKAEVDARTKTHSTPLHKAAQNGNSEAVKALLDGKAEVDAQDKDQWMPLHRAAVREYFKTVK